MEPELEKPDMLFPEASVFIPITPAPDAARQTTQWEDNVRMIKDFANENGIDMTAQVFLIALQRLNNTLSLYNLRVDTIDEILALVETSAEVSDFIAGLSPAQ